MGWRAVPVPRADRELVERRAAELDQVAAGYAADRRLGRRICRQVAAIAPRLPPAPLAVLARYALWTFTLDDRLDVPGADLDALGRLREGVSAVLAGRPPGADPVLVTLADIAADLDRYATGAVRDRFAQALAESVVAGIGHARLAQEVASGGRPPPTAERYLAVAASTVNYRSFGYALLAVGAGELTGRQLACLDPALVHAARATRLGNDLHGAGRDAAAAGLNVLRLRTTDGSPVTPGYVRHQIERQVRRHDAVLGTLTRLGVVGEPPAALLTRCLHQVARLHRRTDLR